VNFALLSKYLQVNIGKNMNGINNNNYVYGADMSSQNIYFTFDWHRKSVRERNANNEFYVLIYFIDVHNNVEHNNMF